MTPTQIKWESPLAMGNASFMGPVWGLAIQKTLMEAHMKKYFPLQYRMMKNLEKQLQGPTP